MDRRNYYLSLEEHQLLVEMILRLDEIKDAIRNIHFPNRM